MLPLTVYCVLIVAASLLGGWLPSLVTLTHKRMQVMMSGVGGLMLGIALFHMLPHALEVLGPSRVSAATAWMMAGLITMFFMLRAFHFHHHETGEVEDGHDHDHAHDHDHRHDHDHDHDHGRAPDHAARRTPDVRPHELSWLGVFLGLGLHTFIDGLALAASVQAARATGDIGIWSLAGAGTFLAILVHKPLDAITITSLMSSHHWSGTARLLASAGFAMMCPLGALLFMLGLGRFSGSEEFILGGALAFSAGVFLCISLSDLLPEMEFHSHHRLLLSTALLAGVALAWVLHLLEPHAHGANPPVQVLPSNSVEPSGLASPSDP